LVHQEDILTGLTKNCLIAIGSNQPFEYIQPFELVEQAIKCLSDEKLRITGVSRLYRTPAYPKDSGPDFINAAVAADTELEARQVIDALHRIEATLGRDRRKRWAPRTLDLDLIDCGGAVLPDEETWRSWAEAGQERQRTAAPEQLILPHPRLQDRGFVLLPLRDVAPGWTHPVTGASVAEMIAALDPADLSEMRPL